LPHFTDKLVVEKLLGLFSLPPIRAINAIKSSHDRLVDDISSIWNDGRKSSDYYSRFANVRIELEDCAFVDSHQTLLASRSDFFGAMLHGSRWMLKRDEDGHVLIDLKHISASTYGPINRWIYTDTLSSSFDEDEEEYVDDGGLNLSADLDELLEFVVEILAAANEILMPAVIDLCGNMLIARMDITNVLSILEVSDMYLSANLKNACLDFICWNITSFVETKSLDSVNESLIEDLELHLKSFQQQKFPRTRGKDGIYSVVRQTVSDNAQARKESRRAEITQSRILSGTMLTPESDSFGKSLDVNSPDLLMPPFDRHDSKLSPVIPFEAIHAEDIFELELELESATLPSSVVDHQSNIKKTPKKKKRFTKLDIRLDSLSLIDEAESPLTTGSPRLVIQTASPLLSPQPYTPQHKSWTNSPETYAISLF
jgi:hypothetical protein